MHDIEPYFKWREKYNSSQDDNSPFYRKEYNEFQYDSKIYNYYIHPQWDFFGSQTLVLKILFVDYLQGYMIIELLGEWNDTIGNDIMFLKREIADHFYEHDISKFILLCDNVLNFHGSDDSYYEEWREDTQDKNGWVALLNVSDHVKQEMNLHMLQNQIHYGEILNGINWQMAKPDNLLLLVEAQIDQEIKYLH